MMTPTKVKQRQDTQRMRSHLPILLSLLQSKQKKMVASIVITGSAEVPRSADEGECRAWANDASAKCKLGMHCPFQKAVPIVAKA